MDKNTEKFWDLVCALGKHSRERMGHVDIETQARIANLVYQLSGVAIKLINEERENDE